MSVVGVAMAVALLLIVTGLAIGIAAPATGAGNAGDYWIVSETSGDSSPLVATGDPQFGGVHGANERIRGNDDVRTSTPLLVDVLRLETDAGTTEYVVAIGVVADADGQTVMGLSTDAMTAGDPLYADGTYDGEWTGEVVLSEGAATLLETETGDTLTVAGHATNRTFTTTGIEASETGNVMGTAPIAVMHLAELQSITGASSHDQADQFLVEATSSSVTSDLAEIYPQSAVLSSDELTTQQLMDSDMGLALSLAAVLVAIVVGSLFIATTMVLEVAADQDQLRTLAAIGIGFRSRLATYGVQALLVAVVGGLVGSLVGAVGIRIANATANAFFDVGSVAVFHPALVGYGVVAALVIGVLTIPVLALAMTRLETGGDRLRA